MKRLLSLFSFTLLVFAIAGCARYSSVVEVDFNLQKKNHRAAKFLIKGANERLALDTPIVVATVSNLNELETSSDLGRVISDHIMTYMVREGYNNVSEIRLRRSLYLREMDERASGEFLLSRDARAIAETRQAGAAVTGTYAVARNEVLVSLRLIEVVSGKVLSSYDYRIPIDSDIERLLADEERVDGAGSFFSSKPIPSF